MRTPFPRLQFFATSIILALLITTSAVSQTQITTGTIQGTVIDANGAVVPGANVEIKNLDTNVARNVTTDEDGRFVAPLLPPGNYSVTVAKQGFATTVLASTVLTVGQALTIPFSLKISSVAETVTVTTTPTVDTVKTEASTTLNETVVSTTPILGRKFEDLLTLTPGVSITQGPDGDEINFSGQRGIFNNVSLDGGDYNNGFFGEQAGGQRAAIDIALEAVKEFQVIATGANAEYGRTAGGIINVITKSGTNDVHGSVFYNQRLKGLTSEPKVGQGPTKFHREQFGGTIGGPIARDRMFFFTNFEYLKQNETQSNLRVVPNALAREGIIPLAAGAAPAPGCVVASIPGHQNCGMGTPNQANFLRVKPYLDLWPLGPNQPGNVTATKEIPGYESASFGDPQDLGNGTSRILVNAESPGTEYFSVGRFDWNVSDRDSFFAR